MDKSELVTSLSRIEFWRDLFAVLVAVGIVGEVFFGLKYTSRSKALHKIEEREQTKLNFQIETLRNKNLELEAKVKSRRLTGNQKESLSKFLADDPGNIAIVSCALDPESTDFADDFDSALRVAHWVTVRIKNRLSNDYGVSVGTLEGTNLGDTKRIDDALTSIGIPHENKTFGEKTKASISPEFQAGVLYLVIEHKPPVTAEGNK